MEGRSPLQPFIRSGHRLFTRSASIMRFPNGRWIEYDILFTPDPVKIIAACKGGIRPSLFDAELESDWAGWLLYDG